MFCTQCGREIKPGADFCPDCGAKIEISRTAPQTPEIELRNQRELIVARERGWFYFS